MCSAIGTFDMTLLQTMVAWLVIMAGVTYWIKPALFSSSEFWLLQVRRLQLHLVFSWGGVIVPSCAIYIIVSHSVGKWAYR